MAIPKYNELYGVVLKSLQDGEVHEYKSIKKFVIEQLGLLESDLAEMLPSGRQTLFDNRVGWARTYLKKAGLIESPSRARFQLTEEGKMALIDTDRIDNQYLSRYPSFLDFYNHSTDNGHSTNALQETNEQSPRENIESELDKINSLLADDLVLEVMKLSNTEFEGLVVKLLIKMGYGSGLEENGIVTQTSNDGGIDGIIKEDQLGFSSIYIQAKQWAIDRTVDRPEVQKFAGALQGQQAAKGLFITTAKFTSGARDFVNNLYGSKIVLVDGPILMRLMIKHNLGVSTECVYELKRIDSDFFADDI